MKHLVVIGLVIPEPKSTAAGTRMLQLLNLFRNADYKITFLTSATNTEFSENLEVKKINLNDESFDILIKELQPDIVLFDRFVTEEQFGWRITENCPQALKILDTEDLHFLREARKTAWKQNRETTDDDVLNDIFKREIAAILRSDLSLIISEFEYYLLTEKFRLNPELLFYIPFLFDGKIPETKTFNDRKNYVSIGNFLHEPNWQTVLQLKKIWPKIHAKNPGSELHVYGAYPSEKVFQLDNKKEGFLIKGRAENAEEIMKNYRVLLAPIPFGAGLKGKLFESMKFGLPNITSSIGAEAMQEKGIWNGFIEDDISQFCEKAVELYRDENLWETSQKNGYEILKNKFGEPYFSENLLKKISETGKNLHQHRNRNYLGQILQHHTLNATKYMSRWIEEKNRNTSS